MRADTQRRRHYFVPRELKLAQMAICRTCGCSFTGNSHCYPPAAWAKGLAAVLNRSGAAFRPIHLTDEFTRKGIRAEGKNVVRGLMAAGLVQCVRPGRGVRAPALYACTAWGIEYLGQTQAGQALVQGSP